MFFVFSLERPNYLMLWSYFGVRSCALLASYFLLGSRFTITSSDNAWFIIARLLTLPEISSRKKKDSCYVFLGACLRHNIISEDYPGGAGLVRVLSGM